MPHAGYKVYFQNACAWKRSYLFAEKHQLPFGEPVCLNSSESVAQRRQKGEQSAPADTLTGLTQKACLGALNLNTHQEDQGKREKEGQRINGCR